MISIIEMKLAFSIGKLHQFANDLLPDAPTLVLQQTPLASAPGGFYPGHGHSLSFFNTKGQRVKGSKQLIEIKVFVSLSLCSFVLRCLFLKSATCDRVQYMSCGRYSQPHPVVRTDNRPLMTSRSSLRGLPVSASGGNNGLMNSPCASVTSDG